MIASDTARLRKSESDSARLSPPPSSFGGFGPIPLGLGPFFYVRAARNDRLDISERGGLVLAAAYDQAIAPATTPTGLNYKGPSAWLAGTRYDLKLAAVSLILGESSNGAFDGQLPGSA